MKDITIGSETQQQYNNVRAFIDRVVDTKELGYVYTFPDKRTYSSVGNSKEFIEKAWEGYEGQMGIYVHTPFCTIKPPPDGVLKQIQGHGIETEGRDHLCGYCNLFTTVVGNAPRGYTDDVIGEAELYKKLFSEKKLEASSIYFGGGTPTILTASDLKRIYDAVGSIVGEFPQDIERAIETAPDLVDRERLAAIKEIGFNRISIGVQTFDERVLHYTGRKYDPMLGYEAVRDALEIGFENVNVDIIIGLPSSDQDTFLRDIELVRELSSHTVTLYQDMTRPVTRFGKMQQAGTLLSIPQDKIYAWTEMADKRLSADGYKRQSLSAWGKDGGGYQQGENIYKSIPVLGIGPGARSHAPNGHYSTEHTVSTRSTNYLIGKWRENIQRGNFPDIHGIEMTPDLKIRERAVLGLMAPDGVSTVDLQGKFMVELQALQDAGIIKRDGMRWKYTERGKAYSGALARIFFGQDIKNRLADYGHR